VKVEALPDQDWIKLSQQGLPPVRAGRFLFMARMMRAGCRMA
jgi:ribosomal protein L11 methylase PrmA